MTNRKGSLRKIKAKVGSDVFNKELKILNAKLEEYSPLFIVWLSALPEKTRLEVMREEGII